MGGSPVSGRRLGCMGFEVPFNPDCSVISKK